jgi:hypothetical protein
MSQLITQYIESKINNKNIVNKIYDFLINNIITNIDDTIIYNNMLIYKKITIPDSFTISHDHYPITEYSYSLHIDNSDVLITLGIDFFGIRQCGDKYCYYIILS